MNAGPSDAQLHSTRARSTRRSIPIVKSLGQHRKSPTGRQPGCTTADAWLVLQMPVLVGVLIYVPFVGQVSAFGRTSAPRWPQTGQTNRCCRSDSRRLSGQQSASITTECPHLWSPQNTRSRRGPDCRICPRVISCSRGMGGFCQKSHPSLNMPFGIDWPSGRHRPLSFRWTIELNHRLPDRGWSDPKR